ncbi:MAG: phage portal protein [Alphaproteobacteria bacterium]|nr:phage portal protein [Alphaproteobacteria bacterium]
MLFDPVLKRLRSPMEKRTAHNPSSHQFAPPYRAATFQDSGAFSSMGFGARIEKGFRRNPVVYRCVRMVSEACASIPLAICENGIAVGSNAVGSNKIANILKRPNPTQSGGELLESLYAYLLLHGNAYLEVVANADDTIGGLYSLRPDRMRLIPSRTGWAQFYDYSVGGKTIRFDQSKIPTPILHFRLFHPQDDHYGLSPMEAATQAINIHNAANSWNQSLFDNAARPSGALVYRGQDGSSHLTDEQFKRLKEELETNFQGAQNAGRPLLLEGGLDWSSISLSPQDMDFIAAKHSAARDIALAFGVPPMLLGIPGDNTYANYAEANRAFWRQTILPLAERITAKLGQHICEGDTNLAMQLDDIPALSEERQRLWQKLNKAQFLTRNEKRSLVGLPPLDETREKEVSQ